MNIRCPHCGHPVEVVDAMPESEVSCSSCGSHFNLLGEETVIAEPPAAKKIGRFETVNVLGTGAFGTVWKARDRELDRMVAIKVPRLHQATPQDAEMFLHEARTAAQLKHPNIVAIHEVGRDADSLYIVSDFVDGVTLGDWLTAHRLTPREAAELCTKLADALHYAHETGVIHRDIKPANIMFDAAGEPHIMDFGLAKRAAGEISMTVEGRILGTPAYMSPEQARGDAHHADRRSDVYSLGAVLFELLTGGKPFRGNTRMLLHQVLHDDPPSPRKLNSNVPRDLENITLKCLEKEPRKRYQTAGAMADDLRRYLNHEPVLARPIGRMPRVWRWTRRNPKLAAAIGVTMISLMTLAIISVMTAVSSSSVFPRAHQQDDTNQVQFDNACDMLNRLLASTDPKTLLNDSSMDQLHKRLADQALSLYREAQVPGPKIGGTTATEATAAVAAYYEGRLLEALGRLEEAKQAYRKAIALEPAPDRDSATIFWFIHFCSRRPLPAPLYRDYGWLLHKLGGDRDAEECLSKSVASYESLFCKCIPLTIPEARDAQGKFGTMFEACIAKYQNLKQPMAPTGSETEDKERFDVGVGFSVKGVEIFNNALPPPSLVLEGLADAQRYLGQVLTARGNFDKAAQAYTSAASLYALLPAKKLDDSDYQQRLAESLSDLAKQRAEFTKQLVVYSKQLTESSSEASQPSSLAETWHNLGRRFADLTLYPEAEQAYGKALPLYEKLVNESPDNATQRQWLALTHYDLGIVLENRKQFALAEPHYRRAIALYAELPSKLRQARDCRSNLAGSWNNLATCCTSVNRDQDAATAYNQAIAVYEGLAKDFPTDAEYRSDLAKTYRTQGKTLTDLKRFAEAEPVLDKAQALYETLAKKEPANPQHRRWLAWTKQVVGWSLQCREQFAAAELHYRQAITLYTELPPELRQAHDCRQNLAGVWLNLARCYAKLGKNQDAESAYGQVISIYAGLVNEYPSVVEFQQALGNGYNSHAWSLVTSDNPKAVAAEAVNLALKAVERCPKTGAFWSTLGTCQYYAGQYDKTMASLRKSIELKGESSYDWFFLAMILAQQGNPTEGRKFYDQAVAWMEKNKPDDAELRRFRQEAASLLGIATAQPTAPPKP